jgi:hypothetical protein
MESHPDFNTWVTASISSEPKMTSAKGTLQRDSVLDIVDQSPQEIYHDGAVKIRSNHFFLGFTTIEHPGDPLIAKYTYFYHAVMQVSINSCGIIQASIVGAGSTVV